ncbi:MAG TPA: hypothetical protein VGM88_28920 [Kofleriaceae bacterium]
MLVLAAACGGGKHTDTYAKGQHVQEACCEHLAGGRDQCLATVPKPPSTDVASSAPNQATYACIVDHFQCDAGTGHPTQASAQAQLECIQALPD